MDSPPKARPSFCTRSPYTDIISTSPVYHGREDYTVRRVSVVHALEVCTFNEQLLDELSIVSSYSNDGFSTAVIASCWATMMYFGKRGYMEAAGKIVDVSRYIEQE